MDLEKLAIVCGLAAVIGVLMLGRASPDSEWRNELHLAQQTSPHHLLLSGWMNMSQATASLVRPVHKKDPDDGGNLIKSRK